MKIGNTTVPNKYYM